MKNTNRVVGKGRVSLFVKGMVRVHAFVTVPSTDYEHHTLSANMQRSLSCPL